MLRQFKIVEETAPADWGLGGTETEANQSSGSSRRQKLEQYTEDEANAAMDELVNYADSCAIIMFSDS